jgi:ABC-type tungstate transport system, permease component
MKKHLIKALSLSLVVILALTIMAGCKNKGGVSQSGSNTNQPANKTIILATTTSTQDSGLLDYLLPKFKTDTGIEVKVVAVGTGQALKLGENGDADVLLVHAKSDEEKFVQAGHGLERFDVMYNDFILIGPKNDPAKIKENAGSDISKAMDYINKNKVSFISRGDDSGTDKFEKNLWKGLNITPSGSWYVSAGKGMGPVIQMANEKLAYTISDRATYLSMKDKTDLSIIVEGDDKLKNQYGVIAVNPNKNSKINKDGAQAFIKWILSPDIQKFISQYGKDKYNQSLFIPNAK